MREAQAIARVSHPNVVVVYDVGTFGNRVFIAMELVGGTHAALLDARAGPDLARGAGGVRGGGARAGGSARARAGSPRLQARQRHDCRRRPGAGHGLRSGAAGRRANRRRARRTDRQGRNGEHGDRRPADEEDLLSTQAIGANKAPRPDSGQRAERRADQNRRRSGDTRLYVAGAVPQRTHRRPHRSVQLLRRALRGALRRTAVPRARAFKSCRSPSAAVRSASRRSGRRCPGGSARPCSGACSAIRTDAGRR